MILMVNGQQQSVSTPTDSLTRAVIISLFTWRRADPDDDSEQPMGWWGDSYPTVQNDRTTAECVINKLCPSHTYVIFLYPE